MGHFRQIFVLFWALLGAGNALTIDVNDTASIKHAASEAAYGMMKFYTGNLTGQIPGLLPPPYYWWEGGAMWMCLIDYWAVTGDSTYNPQVTESLLFQVGPHNDYMPPNQTASMGNDDQAFWAMAALSAAENNFPNPTNPKDPSWLSLAQAVFNEQVGRWDDSSCGGGLHWQAIEVNKGYSLKNTISNGSLMQIAARLARYLGDDRYADWATKLWDWMVSVKLIDTGNWSVYDNTESVTQNCTTIDRHQWTYNAGTLLISCATMWNYTEDEIWKNRTIGLLNTIEFDFFPNGIMKEICEEYNACNPDQHSFKAYLSRWMAATTKMAPFTTDQVLKLLRSSAVAVAQQCTCGQDNRQCGLKWTHNSTCDGDYGPGQQMAAMEVFLGLLVKNQSVPLTNSTGGTSSSNPNAGFNQSSVPPGSYIAPPSRADKAGAWFLTALFGVGAIWLIWFLSSDACEDGEPTIPGEALTPRQRKRLLKGRSDASVLPQSMVGETIQLRPKSDEIREKAVPIQYLESLPTPPDSPPLDSDSPSLESVSPVMSTCRLHETGSGLFSGNYTLGYGKGGRLSSVVCNRCRWGSEGDGDGVSEISRSGLDRDGDGDTDRISEVSRSNSGSGSGSGAGSMREKG